ncbi:MAG: hypothetical protein J6U42_05530, partial [Lachnospiraceae bacterium]|nr:hypothetical protein [Lachnospiraceae bacterium]
MKKKNLLRFFGIVVSAALLISGCSGKTGEVGITPEPTKSAAGTQAPVNTEAPAETPAAPVTEAPDEGKNNDNGIPDMTAFLSAPSDGDYIELVLNVYYNDSDHSYFSNESGKEHIYVTTEGQYALTFDCEKDLSDKAVSASVSALKNLTAIYITDMQVLQGTGKSALKSCNIMYDRIIVDGTELTVTL